MAARADFPRQMVPAFHYTSRSTSSLCTAASRSHTAYTTASRLLSSFSVPSLSGGFSLPVRSSSSQARTLCSFTWLSPRAEHPSQGHRGAEGWAGQRGHVFRRRQPAHLRDRPFSGLSPYPYAFTLQIQALSDPIWSADLLCALALTRTYSRSERTHSHTHSHTPKSHNCY